MFLKLLENEKNFLILMLIIALFIRLLFLPMYQVVTSDGGAYLSLGENLIKGNGYVDLYGKTNLSFPPLYPLATGITWFFINDIELAGRIVSLIFGVLLIIPVYYLTKIYYNKKSAYIAVLFTTFYFHLIHYSVETMVESMYIFLLVIAIYFGLFAINKKYSKYYIYSGIVLGLCYLLKPEAIMYILIIIFITFFYRLIDYKKNTVFIQILKNIIFMLFFFFIIISPYLLLLYTETGQLNFSAKSQNLLIGEKNDELSYEYMLFRLVDNNTKVNLDTFSAGVDPFQYIITHQQELTSRYITNIWEEMTEYFPKIFPIWLIAIITIGLFTKKWDKKRLKNEFYLFLTIILPLLIFPFFHIMIRFLIPIIPFLLVWFSNGLIHLQDWFIDTFRNSFNINPKLDKSFFFKNLVVILFFISILPLNYYIIPTHQHIEQKEMGIWVSENIEDPVIMSRGYASFYTKKIIYPVPYSNYTDLIKYAKYNNINYLIMDELTAEVRPELEFLIDPGKIPEEFEIIYKIENNENVYLYKLKH